MSEKSVKKDKLFVVSAVYSSNGVVINRNEIHGTMAVEGFWVDKETTVVMADFISHDKVNVPQLIDINDNGSIMLLMYAYKISEFALKLELRKKFLKTLDDRRDAIMQLITNFEESFKNAK